MTFPRYAVSKSIGHSSMVSGKHYANDAPDEIIHRAPNPAGAAAAQKAAQNRGESTETDGDVKQKSPVFAGFSAALPLALIGATGVEPATSWSRTKRSTNLSAVNKGVKNDRKPACTSACTFDANPNVAIVDPRPEARDATAALSMIAALPLSDAEKTAAVRLLLGRERSSSATTNHRTNRTRKKG